MAAVDDSISLRPGGAGMKNPFASFAMGAGLGLKNKAALAASTDEKKKPRGEVVKYPRDFLMKFAEVYTRLPTELQFSNLEIVLDPSDPDREAQRQLLQRVAAENSDERDWRARTPLPPPEAPGKESTPTDPTAPKIQRATDVGRTAWAAGNTTNEGAAQSLRKVKGILNKLTPEKFERLLGQLIPLISSYEVLQGTISQVFENAVAQPTFVSMYADLCAELDASLPEFPDTNGEPHSFKKMLANTCQEEYESTEDQRNKAAQLSVGDRDDAQRKAKQRLLGNIRLIAELFKKSMVNDRIMILILGDLLGPSTNEPSEDSVEAACELITIGGGALESNPKSKARLDNVFQHLSKLSNSKTYAPRVRFVIKDVMDLRSQHWVARRETFTAKKLDEIRSEAQAELGIVDVEIPGLAPLVPGLDPLAAQRKDDVELFPAFRGGAADAVGGGNAGGDEKYTTLLGEFTPLTIGGGDGAADDNTVQKRVIASEEDRISLAKSIYTDYISSNDIKEATTAAQEIMAPGFGSNLVSIGIEKAYDALKSSEQNAIIDVIVAMAGQGPLTGDDIVAAVDSQSLDDISLDIPAAPRVLGRLLGLSSVRGVVDVTAVEMVAEKVESAEPRRAFVASCFNAIKEVEGEEKMVGMVKGSGMDVARLFEHDAEFENHLVDGMTFAKEEGLLALL